MCNYFITDAEGPAVQAAGLPAGVPVEILSKWSRLRAPPSSPSSRRWRASPAVAAWSGVLRERRSSRSGTLMPTTATSPKRADTRNIHETYNKYFFETFLVAITLKSLSPPWPWLRKTGEKCFSPRTRINYTSPLHVPCWDLTGFRKWEMMRRWARYGLVIVRSESRGLGQRDRRGSVTRKECERVYREVARELNSQTAYT